MQIRLCKSKESVKKHLTKRAIDRRDWRRLSLLTSSASCLLEAWKHVCWKGKEISMMRERIEQQVKNSNQNSYCRLASKLRASLKRLAPKMFYVVNMIWDGTMINFILPSTLFLKILFLLSSFQLLFSACLFISSSFPIIFTFSAWFLWFAVYLGPTLHLQMIIITRHTRMRRLCAVMGHKFTHCAVLFT